MLNGRGRRPSSNYLSQDPRQFNCGGSTYRKGYNQSLGVEYRKIPHTPTYSFTEFWQAWQNGTLATLLDKYGMVKTRDENIESQQHRTMICQLREFLTFPVGQHELHPSIWRLRHFLVLKTTIPLSNFPKVDAAIREYCFTSQFDARTRIALRQLYDRLLQEIDPLQVHEAKNSGKLLEYAEMSCRDIDEKVRDVLRIHHIHIALVKTTL